MFVVTIIFPFVAIRHLKIIGHTMALERWDRNWRWNSLQCIIILNVLRFNYHKNCVNLMDYPLRFVICFFTQHVYTSWANVAMGILYKCELPVSIKRGESSTFERWQTWGEKYFKVFLFERSTLNICAENPKYKVWLHCAHCWQAPTTTNRILPKHV